MSALGSWKVGSRSWELSVDSRIRQAGFWEKRKGQVLRLLWTCLPCFSWTSLSPVSPFPVLLRRTFWPITTKSPKEIEGKPS